MIDDEPDTEEPVPTKKADEALPKAKRGNKNSNKHSVPINISTCHRGIFNGSLTLLVTDKCKGDKEIITPSLKTKSKIFRAINVSDNSEKTSANSNTNQDKT